MFGSAYRTSLDIENSEGIATKDSTVDGTRYSMGLDAGYITGVSTGYTTGIATAKRKKKLFGIHTGNH